MLFKACFIEPILKGIKTETRRPWSRCIIKEGGIYKARTGYSRESVFALIEITYIRRERLGNIDAEGAKREGVNSVDEFIKLWSSVYGSWDPDTPVFVIGFRLLNA